MTNLFAGKYFIDQNVIKLYRSCIFGHGSYLSPVEFYSLIKTDSIKSNLCQMRTAMQRITHYYSDDSRFAPSQWETSLHCNDVSHWLGASLESALLLWHYVSAMASRIISNSTVCLPCLQERKHQNPHYWPFARDNNGHRWISLTKGQ